MRAVVSPERVRTLYRAGQTMIEIGYELGCSKTRVGQILKRLGEETRRPTVSILPERVRQLWDGGKAPTAIGRELGCSTERVRQILRAQGVQARSAPKVDPVVAQPGYVRVRRLTPKQASAALIAAIRQHHPERCGQ